MKWIVMILILLIVLYLFFICPRVFHKPDRSILLHRHYAHRGLFNNESDAPENSLAAFQKAVDAGYGIELDVQLTKDDIAVVFHDANLKRMCNMNGNVWDYTYEELQTFHLANSKETIPAFEAVLNLISGRVPLIIEYKLDRPSTKVCEIGDKLLREYRGSYCIESFHPNAVAWYKKHRPEVIRGQLSQEFFRKEELRYKPIFYALSFLLTNVITRPDFIAYNHKHASNISRCLCRWLGALSVAYTVKSEEEYQKVKSKFDLFIFDSFILK